MEKKKENSKKKLKCQKTVLKKPAKQHEKLNK
jgi:hypothetical protein